MKCVISVTGDIRLNCNCDVYIFVNNENDVYTCKRQHHTARVLWFACKAVLCSSSWADASPGLKSPNKWIIVFNKEAFNWSKVTVKTCIMLQKITIVKKCCSFESEDPENKYIAVSTQILNNKTVFRIDDKKLMRIRNIRMIFFSVPCDTKDRSNDAENSALHHRNKVQ